MGFSEDRAQGRFGSFYLLIAENPYLLWDAAEHWKAAWRRQAGDDLRVETFTAPHIDFDRLLGAGATMPMFETTQLVLIRDVEKVTGKKQEELIRILQQSSPSTKWLLTAAELDRRTVIGKKLATFGPVEEFKRVYPDQVSGWVTRIAADLDTILAPPAVELIASVHGTDLFAVRQTIERVALYVGKRRRIEAADIEVVLAGEGEYDVFQLLEAASRSDFVRGLAIARALAASASRQLGELSVWLSLIYGQCQRYLKILELSDRPIEEIAQQLHIHIFLMRKLHRQATDLGYDALIRTCEAAFETDFMVKTSKARPALAWELFVWRIVAGRNIPPDAFLDLSAARSGE
ncbi:MAG TPA: DNA polymerase III subunit delta [bacterium]|nr:DNA polymerase III subunit delta [bacterium]